MTQKRKIMIVTGTRADYGLLRHIVREVHQHPALELSLVVTGSHLSKDYGETVSEIEQDGIPVAHRLPILGEGKSVADSMALALGSLSKVIQNEVPHILVILGDRYEAMAAATAGTLHQIPIAHIHGGELTLGAIDDSFRHAITKMSWWHFASTEEYRKRIVHLGEAPERTFNVGAPALDAIDEATVTTEELEKFLGLKLMKPVLLATLHPETLNPGKAVKNLSIVWEGIKQTQPGTVIFTKANADAEGNELNQSLEKLVASKTIPHSVLVSSLGHKRYMSLMKLADVAIGNSSSLVIEAPMVHTPSVNIGKRQEGRVRSPSIIDVDFDSAAISAAIKKATSTSFRESVRTSGHPFGKSGVALRVVDILSNCELPKNLIKAFYE